MTHGRLSDNEMVNAGENPVDYDNLIGHKCLKLHSGHRIDVI